MTTQSRIQNRYKDLSLLEQKQIFLSQEGWLAENQEPRQPCKDMKPETWVAFQKNGKWVVEQFSSYREFLESDKISINQNTLTFFPLDEINDKSNPDVKSAAMDKMRKEILHDKSPTSIHTLYQNSFMKNVADYPVDGDYCHKSVYADNSVKLEKLKRQITELSLELSKYEKNEKGGFNFLTSAEEADYLQPFTDAIITTLEEVGIHKDTTIDPTEMEENIGILTADLFYNFANNKESKSARDVLEGQLKLLIPILLRDKRLEVFSGLAAFAGENQLATGFKEAIDKTKGELHTCYNLFVNEYGEEFTKMSSLEQEWFMRNKSIMYPGVSTQAMGYPDVLFVGKDNKLVYAAPTKKNMTNAAGFESNQIVRHPLDIFYNMKLCFELGDEVADIENFEWSEENINKFKEHSADPKNWIRVPRWKESVVGSEHLKTLLSDQYKAFNIVSHQIFPFPTRKTVDDMFKDAKLEITDDELGTFYTCVFAIVSGHVLAFDQEKDNAKVIRNLHVANINETKMKFHSMVERIGDNISDKLSSLFIHHQNKFNQDPETELNNPENDLLMMAGMVTGRSVEELKMFAPAAGSDLNSSLNKLFSKEETQRADKNGARADSFKADYRLEYLKAERLALSGIANDPKLHLPSFPTKLFTQTIIRDDSVVEVVSGRETDAIRYLLVNTPKPEQLIGWLEESVPTFYPAYQDCQEAMGILKSMSQVYKEGTSKGEMLKQLTEGLASEFPKEILVEYVISMSFAKDMEEKTVDDIIKAAPLSKCFNEDDVGEILPAITYGKTAKADGQKKSIKK